MTVRLDATTRFLVPTGSRLVVNRDTIRGIIQHFGAIAQEAQDDTATYAKGIVDGLSLLLDPDHPDDMITDLLDFPTPREDPYCAQHGRPFDNSVGCPECLAELA